MLARALSSRTTCKYSTRALADFSSLMCFKGAFTLALLTTHMHANYVGHTTFKIRYYWTSKIVIFRYCLFFRLRAIIAHFFPTGFNEWIL